MAPAIKTITARETRILMVSMEPADLDCFDYITDHLTINPHGSPVRGYWVYAADAEGRHVLLGAVVGCGSNWHGEWHDTVETCDFVYAGAGRRSRIAVNAILDARDSAHRKVAARQAAQREQADHLCRFTYAPLSR